jgi:hypothetical protein
MSASTEIVVHLGYPKTATTTFQHHVFPNHPDIDYIGKFIPSHRYRESETFFQVDALVRVSRLRAADIFLLRDYVQKIREESNRKIVLLSSESFLHPTAADIATVIERVKQVFSPCKVWLTLREQTEVLRSFHAMHGQYGQYFYIDVLDQKERLKFPIDFDTWIELQKRAPDKNLLGTLQYNDVISCLIEHFGRSSIHVSIYEELLTDASSYVGKLSRALGFCEKKALALLANNRANVSAKASFWDQLVGKRRKSSPSANQVAFLDEYYRAGNRALSNSLELPLAAFGYKV